MTVKRKAKRRAMTIKLEAKRKAVTESEILPKRGESLSLWRVPTLEEANEMRRRSKKGERARQREREAWLASDKYKAIAKHCKAALVTARKPGNPRGGACVASHHSRAHPG